jgi:hypothetical protein
MKAISMTVLLMFLAGAWVLADEQSDREKLIGSWQLQDSPESDATTSWTFSDKGKGLHVTQREGASTVADFDCHVTGSSCEIKVSGKSATLSMWFNGAMLVQMETKGSDVLKRRFSIIPQSDASSDVMEVEIMPITPSGKPKTLHYKRSQLSALGK